MRFTVVTPIWNRAHYVKQCVQSILDQSFEDWEMVIIDDGSTDGTWKALQEVRIDKRIRPVRMEKHAGLYDALTMGNTLAQGEIIVKHDSDDVSLPNRLEVIDKCFKKEPFDFFYHSMYQLFEDDSDANVIRRDFIKAREIDKSEILKHQYIPGCFAYTKKFITETPYRKSWVSDDWMLILDAVLRNKKIEFTEEALYEYVLREDSNSIYCEGTGRYEEDEKTMKKVLLEEYGIKHFSYAPRN